MRVLILADEIFATREPGLLSRLEVGLADEGVRVIHAAPETALAYAPAELVSRRLTYPQRRWSLGLSATARSLARQAEESAEANGGGDIDLVHVFGGAGWSLGASLARELETPLVVEVWRTGLAARAREFSPRDVGPPLFIAPDAPIERALRADGEAMLVRLAPWGVVAPARAPARFVPERSISVMVIGSGRDRAAFVAAIEGVAYAIRDGADALIFCDAQAARRAELWSVARRMGVLERLSLIADLEARRDLVLQGDVLVQPDANGEQRSITLEAMAGGMSVVAAEDPGVSLLQEGLTARLVRRADGVLWAGTLREVLGNAEGARALGESARQFVAAHRRASEHVRSVLEAYTWIIKGDVLAFRGV